MIESKKIQISVDWYFKLFWVMWLQPCHFLKIVKAILSYSNYFYLNFTQLRLIFLKSLYQELSKEVWHMCIKLGELKKLLQMYKNLNFQNRAHL